MDRGYDFHAGNGTFGSGTDNGNVFAITNYRDTTRSQAFTYDALNRLTSGWSLANTGNYSWGENYPIDAWGNLQVSPMSGKAHGGTFQLSGNAQNRPTGMAYDAAGNLMSYLSSTYTYDQENRLSSTAGMSYTYDGNGERVLKSNTSTGAVVKRYWSMGGNTLAEGDGTGNLTAEYIYFGSKRVARIDLPANTVHYYLSDHLNSTSMVVSSSGIPEEESDYSPFGTEYVITGAGVNRYKFTSKERDSESALDNYGARYYGAALGRFVTPDWSPKPVPVPFVDLHDPQTLNQYAYVRNNPLSKDDPDGHCGTPSGLGPGQVGVCVASYISSNTVGVIGRGDGRGPNGQGGTSRIETRLVVDPSKHTATKTDETINRSGIIVKDVGPKGVGGSNVSSTQTDNQGNTYFQVSQDAHSSYSMGGAVLGSIDNHLNLAVTPDGKVGIDAGSSAKDFPSLEVYRYSMDDKGNVATTQVFTKQESGHVSDLKQPEKPIKPQEPK